LKRTKIVVFVFLILIVSSTLFSQIIITKSLNDTVNKKDTDSIVGIVDTTLSNEKSRVKVGENIIVLPEDTISGDAVTIGGNLDVQGFVKGDAVCIGGNLHISGTVQGDATVIGGRATIDSTAFIKGDLTSIAGRIHRQKGARIKGAVNSISIPILRSVLPFAFKFTSPHKTHIYYHPFISSFAKRITIFGVYTVKIIALIVFILLILLFFKTGVERVSDAIEHYFWRSVLAGFIGEILFIPLTILLLVLIIGIPLIPLLWMVIVAALIFGYTGIAYTIGRIAAERRGWINKSPYILGLIGLVVIEIIPFFGRLVSLPGGGFVFVGGVLRIIGFIISFVATIAGLGGVILTRFGFRKFGK